MVVTFTFRKRRNLPPLAWVLVAEQTKSNVVVHHGPGVEVFHDWFAEAVWDGSFDRPGLLQAKNLFGTAGVCEGGRCILFTPTSLVDRIITAIGLSSVVASNSLPLLLATTGAELDPEHDYCSEQDAPLAGVDSYVSKITCASPEWKLDQHFYGKVILDPQRLSIKRCRYENHPEFHTFADVDATLRGAVAAIAKNARESNRRNPVSRLSTTLSSGYDSTAVSALAAEVGADLAFTRRQASRSVPRFFRGNDDDGRPAAKSLGLTVVELNRPSDGDWLANIELGLLAGSPTYRELALLPAGIELSREPGLTILFTGYHGDKAWDRSPDRSYMGTNIVRGDVSGLPLSEARIHCGFFTVPLPFIGAENIAGLVAVSQSAEMQPWSLGGAYDRPIPRRIAEEAGVPREVFGQKKNAIWQFVSDLVPKHPELRKRYHSEVMGGSSLSVATMRWLYVVRLIIHHASIRLLGGRSIWNNAGFVPDTVPERYIKLSVNTYHWATRLLVTQYKRALN